MTDEKSGFFIRATIPSRPFFLGEPGTEDLGDSSLDVDVWAELAVFGSGDDFFGISDFSAVFELVVAEVWIVGDETFGSDEFDILVFLQLASVIAWRSTATHCKYTITQ